MVLRDQLSSASRRSWDLTGQIGNLAGVKKPQEQILDLGEPGRPQQQNQTWEKLGDLMGRSRAWESLGASGVDLDLESGGVRGPQERTQDPGFIWRPWAFEEGAGSGFRGQGQGSRATSFQ